MPESMRAQISDDDFETKYQGLGITIKVLSDVEWKKFLKEGEPKTKKRDTKKAAPIENKDEDGAPVYADQFKKYSQLHWRDPDTNPPDRLYPPITIPMDMRKKHGKVMKMDFYEYLKWKGIYESDYVEKAKKEGDGPITVLGLKPESAPEEAEPTTELQKSYKREPKIKLKIKITGKRPDEETEARGSDDKPEQWTGYDFLYPELDDPDFNIKIAKRKEFHDTQYDGNNKYDIETRANELCKADFELSPHQQFVKNFLSTRTPYNSLLLYHGLGTGKTCSAIGVAEEMREYMKQIGQRKPIMIIAMPNVQDNFRLQLFDPRKLEFNDGIWTIESCIGNSLLREINPTGVKGKADDRENIVEQINHIINQYYVFMGYTSFANYMSSVIDAKGASEEKINRDIKNVFDNRLVIIDEAHNIRITNENKNRKAAELLMEVAKRADSMRLLLLSATPVYNTPEEIIWMVNLMNQNDKRGRIEIIDVFKSDGSFKEGGRELLKRKLTGYISYVRGENPYTFPYRIYPENRPLSEYPTKQMNGKKIESTDHKIPIFINKIGEYQEKGYRVVIEDLKNQASDQFEDMDTFKYTLLMAPIESLNIVYPYDEADDPSDIAQTITGKSGLSRVMSYKETSSARFNFQYKNPGIRIFSKDELPKYSSKMAKICDIIRESKKGIILIYSQYIDGGSVPMALALEEMGFSRFGSEKQTKSLFAKPPTEPLILDTGGVARYVMITGDKLFSPNNDEDIKALNSIENAEGNKIKVVLISKAAGEGIDFKNIRQVHILEPWYNMNRIEQIIGRGVRNKSHCALPFKERTVEIFLHATSLTDSTEESADMYMYRLAEKKAGEIGQVTRLLKETAVDCILNVGQTKFSVTDINAELKLELSNGKTIQHKIGDESFTDICDYMECDMKCSPSAKITDADTTKVTYDEQYIGMNNEAIVKRIREIFSDPPKGRHFFKRGELLETLSQYPESQILYALTFLIDNKNEHITDKYGRTGNLVNNGEYYMFQPIEITDDAASMYERTRPIDVNLEAVLVKLPNMKKNVDDNYDTLIGNIKSNYDAVFNQTRKLNNKDWYNNANLVKDYIVENYISDEDLLKKYIIYHILDGLGLADTLTIINKIFQPSKDEIVPFIREYYRDKTVTSNKKSGYKGFVLCKEDKPFQFYVQNESGDLEEASLSDKLDFMESSDYRDKFIINKSNKQLLKDNRIVGFMSWAPKERESVFKMRDLTTTVNTKGARAGQADVGDIINTINIILGKDTYTEENVKQADSIGEGKLRLVVFVELLLRHKGSQSQNKLWFLNSEQMDINSIQKIGKKEKK
jgi:superfamily II DNA or RNA helicase